MPRIALLLFLAVLVTGAITVPGAEATSAGKFRVVIDESGSVSSLQGRFGLFAPSSADSGTSALQVQISPVRYRGGGPSVNAGPILYIEYGTWRISSASGIYKGWKGGGNWGGTDNEQTYHFQWEGLITR